MTPPIMAYNIFSLSECYSDMKTSNSWSCQRRNLSINW